MSARKIKKMSMKEVKAPDEFQMSMAKVIDFMQQYGAWVLAGLGAVVVAIVGGILVSRHQDASALEKSQEFDRAFAPVADQITLEPAEPVEGDEEGAADAASKKVLATAADDLDKFAVDNPETSLARLALFTRGAAAMGSGDSIGAAAAYRAYVDAAPDTILRSLAWEGLGIAADRNGKRDEAEAAFAEAAKAPSSLQRATAFLHLGDLYNPTASVDGEKAPDPGKALDFYKNGLQEVSGEPNLMPPAKLLVRRTLEQRIAALP